MSLWGNKFKKVDIYNQVGLSAINSTFILATGSLLPCIILHLAMNLPTIMYLFRCNTYHNERRLA